MSERNKQLKRMKRLRTSRIILNVIGAVILFYGIWKSLALLLDYKRSETTNDAQVEQYLSPINVKVPGYIKKIYFQEHQFVRKGDTLLVIDDQEYKIRLKEAEAVLKDAYAGADVMTASIHTTQSNVSVFNSSMEELEVRIEKLRRDYARYSNLYERKAATEIQVEQQKMELEAMEAKLSALKQQKRTAESTVNEVSTRKGNTEAAIMRAEANLEMARLNLSYTVVTSPCDGYLGRRALEEGQLINAGQNLTYIVPNTQKWIVANYKETQIKNLRVGQSVKIKIDAFHDQGFEGRITAISSATGSKYSLVPADNSTGNFIKIQQRIPVRIDFITLSEEDNNKLAAGMMAVVKAKL